MAGHKGLSQEAPAWKPEGKKVGMLIGKSWIEPIAMKYGQRRQQDEGRPGGRCGSPDHLSQVWTIALVNFQAYFADFGFFEAPLARARTVMGTSRMRRRCRMPSINSSEVQN